MTFLLALDQGTTSSRAMVFRPTGEIVAMAQQEFAQSFPQSGWVEQDGDEIWSSQLACAKQALAQAKLAASDLAGLGITNQRETTLLWERATGRPIHPALVWQDRRTAPLCADLKNGGHEALIRTRTGLVLDPYFSATKVAWILDQVPGARARAERGELAFGTVDSWLLWKLTEGELHATDVTNASRTMLYDIHQSRWDSELLDLLRIPQSLLPQVLPSASLFGHTAGSLLGSPVPIGGVAGDQQAALFGQACFQAGFAKNTYGTGCFLLLATGETSRDSSHGLLTTRCAGPEARPTFALEGSVFVGGAVVQWLRDGLGIIRQASEVEALARSVPDSGGVVCVPAFTGLGSPRWDPHARGGLLGLSRGTTSAHVARAAVESIAFQSAEVMEAMGADANLPIQELRVDGGAAANNLLLQFQADLLGIPVVRPKVLETTALGVASLAGLTGGLWPDLATLGAQWREDRRFEPALSRDEAAARMDRWKDAVSRVEGWERPL